MLDCTFITGDKIQRRLLAQGYFFVICSFLKVWFFLTFIQQNFNLRSIFPSSFNVLEILFIFILRMWVFCLPINLCTTILQCPTGQERAPEPLELDLKMVFESLCGCRELSLCPSEDQPSLQPLFAF